MAIKAINDTASLNRLVLTLLVYRAYLNVRARRDFKVDSKE
jgi:hypothetical protein